MVSKQQSTPTAWAANSSLPLPLGRGVCETKSKIGCSKHRKSLMHRVYSARRGIETMVSEGARPWSRGRSEFANMERLRISFVFWKAPSSR